MVKQVCLVYVVFKERRIGVYNSRPECLEQINSYDNWVIACVYLKLIMIQTCNGLMLFDVKKTFDFWFIEVWYVITYIEYSDKCFT